MAQDLAALAPSLIVCVAFLIGAGMLIRHELAPKRRGPANGEQRTTEGDDGSES